MENHRSICRPSFKSNAAKQHKLISRTEKKKKNCTPVPEGKQLSGYRILLCSSNCQVAGSGANASCPFPFNWLRDGLQVKEIPVLLFLSGCSLKGVSVF